MAKLFVAAASLLAAPAAADLTSNNTDIAKGLAEGIVGDKDVAECISTIHTPFADIKEAMHDIEQKTVPEVLTGLRKLLAILKDFPAAMRECKAPKADIEQLATALKMLAHPHTFASHVGKELLVNREDIDHDLETATSDYQAQQWEAFGTDIGRVIKTLLVGKTVSSLEELAVEPKSPEDLFEEFVHKFHKHYESLAERDERFQQFKRNLVNIATLQQSEKSSAAYSHLTPFADISFEEFSALHGFRPDLAHEGLLSSEPAAALDTSSLPTSFDWREKGAVNAVKNQGGCGSCWAFSTVANVEGVAFVEHGKLVSLSEQELVDCDKKTGDQGCRGGLPSNALKDMSENGLGLELESAYPYSGRDDQCQVKKSNEQVFVKSWTTVSGDEDQMAAALVKYGPLSIGINAGPMQWYLGGVANPLGFLCDPKGVDHGVAIVGFGEQKTLPFFKVTKFWIIRNSWGSGWGEKGYYRIVRGVGKCGLNTMVTTATGVSFANSNEKTVVV